MQETKTTVVAITGASGMVGTALTEHLGTHYDVRPVVRDEPRGDEIAWSVTDQTIDADALSEVDAVIHLAGESLVGLRWTEAKKRRIWDSRVDGTGLIARTMAELDEGPKLLLSASAVGYYGDTGTEWVDESDPRGEGFLAEVCEAWEEATVPAREAGVQVVNMRFALILASGGVLQRMLPAFKMGVGGTIGDGSQYFPWVALADVIGAIEHLLEGAEEGPVNVVSPNPVTNEEFTETLGDVLSRPTFMKLPKFAVKAAFGEMGEEALLMGQRARPAKLLDAGFEFLFEDLENALRHVLE